MMMITTSVTKVTTKYYNYAPLPITMFYMHIFYPLVVLLYISKYGINNILKLTKKQLVSIIVPGLIGNGELVILYWCLLYVPLGFYMVGRTFSAFINVLFTKYYIKKTIHKYYYIGLGLLLVSYILFLIGLKIDVNSDKNYILSIILVFVTGFSTAVYNNMGEKYFMTVDDTMNNKLVYLLLFNLPGFLLILPITTYYAVNNSDFTSEFNPNIIYVFTGLCNQIYVFIKLYILSFKDISGNQLLTGAELVRRVLTNITAYLWFNEYYNMLIISANIIMFIGSIFLIKGSMKSRHITNIININKNNEDNEEETININIDNILEEEKVIIIENINEIDEIDDIDNRNYTDTDKLITTKM